MKTVELTSDDAVFEKILSFPELLPNDKIQLRVSDTHIPSHADILPVDLGNAEMKKDMNFSRKNYPEEAQHLLSVYQ